MWSSSRGREPARKLTARQPYRQARRRQRQRRAGALDHSTLRSRVERAGAAAHDARSRDVRGLRPPRRRCHERTVSRDRPSGGSRSSPRGPRRINPRTGIASAQGPLRMAVARRLVPWSAPDGVLGRSVLACLPRGRSYILRRALYPTPAADCRSKPLLSHLRRRESMSVETGHLAHV